MPVRVGHLVLSLLPLLSGCKACLDHVEAVEYHPGADPIVIPSKYDASYTLYEPEIGRGQPGYEVAKGKAVGFRREPNGSLVAIADGETIPLPEGRYVWEYKPRPVTRWDRVTFGARDGCQEAAETVALVVLLPPWLLWQVLTGGELP